MLHRTLIGQRLIALFILGWLAFNYPLLSLFNSAGTWFGVPRLYAYLFVAWIAFICLLLFIAEKSILNKKKLAADGPAPALKD